jgi:hypothetical protein
MLLESKCCKFDISADPMVAPYERSEERCIDFADTVEWPDWSDLKYTPKT